MNHEGRSSARTRVLVAEADLTLREALCRAIELSPGLVVCGTARDGIEALEKVRVLHPEVVILDSTMPLLHGIEVLRHIMRHFARPVIMFSSLTQHEAELTILALGLGAFDYFAKPEAGSQIDEQKLARELGVKIQAAVSGWTSRRQAGPLRPLFRWPDHQSLRTVPEIVAIGA